MVIMTNKKYKKMQTTNLIVGCTGVGLGVVGTTLGTVSLVKSNKTRKRCDSDLERMQGHINTLENAMKKACREVAVMQQACLEHGIIK